MSPTKDTDEHPSTPEKRKSAHMLIALVFCGRLTQTMMRMCVGTLVINICESFACSETWKGWLLSAHAAGYCTTQIIGGQIADRIGGYRVVTVCMIVSGLALAMTSTATAAMGLNGIALTQFCMGIATGPLFPATLQLLAKRLPASDRALASTTLDTGITVGSLLVVPISSRLAVKIGWETTFMVFGIVPILYAFLWMRFAGDDESLCTSHNGNESTAAKDNSKRLSGTAAILKGVQYARLWAIYFAHFTFNYLIYFINSWNATYYLEVFNLRPEQAGLHLSLPHGVNLMVKIFFNPALDHFLRSRGTTNVGCRRAFTGIGFFLSALSVAFAPAVGHFFNSPSAMTICMSLALGFAALHPSGFKANYMDVTTAHSGVVSGIGNTIASLASTIGPLVVAQMRSYTGSWTPAFTSVAALQIVAMVFFCTLSSATPIESDFADDEKKSK